MNITDFRPFEESHKLATIKVTEGTFIFKKTKTRTICCEMGNEWYFTDTGKLLPFQEIQNIVLSYYAMKEYYEVHGI